MDRTLEMLCDRMSDEIEDTVKLEKLSPASLDMLDKAVDILKDVKEIEAMSAVGGYSGNNYQKTYNGNSYDEPHDMAYRRYSRNNNATMSKLEQMYDSAQSDKEREIIRKIMTQM